MKHLLGQVIEVELTNLWLSYRRYLPRPEKKFHLWSIFPHKSISYKNILSRMKKNNLTPTVLLGTYNIHLYRIVGFICHFLMKGQSDSYHLLAPILTLYFDASGSFILPLPWIRNKDCKPKRILIYALITHHPYGNAPPLAFFEHIAIEHNILSIRQPFLRFKETELKLFGNYQEIG